MKPRSGFRAQGSVPFSRAQSPEPRTRRKLRLLISAGPTREPIDRVRYLSNYSTGYMGAQLAAQAQTRGHRVTIVSGPTLERMPAAARLIPVETSAQMARALVREAPRADAIIMAAAVADFRPVRLAAHKLARRGHRMLALEATQDIVAHLPRKAHQVMVGFAVESAQVVARAKRKLRRKQLDLLLAQRANGMGAPFGRRQVQAWLLEQGGKVTPLGRISKPRAARVLLDKAEALWYGQNV